MPFAVVAQADQGTEFKAMLDTLHRRKIDRSDRIIVVSDESGYYGESTRGEIDYASEKGKVCGSRRGRMARRGSVVVSDRRGGTRIRGRPARGAATPGEQAPRRTVCRSARPRPEDDGDLDALLGHVWCVATPDAEPPKEEIVTKEVRTVGGLFADVLYQHENGENIGPRLRELAEMYRAAILPYAEPGDGMFDPPAASVSGTEETDG